MNSIKRPTAIEKKRRKGRPHSRKGMFVVERRRHERFPIQSPLDYSLIDRRTVYDAGMTLDASEGGLQVYLPESISIGAVLGIEIFYVDNSGLARIRAIAKVVWSKVASEQGVDGYRYGLEFQSIDQKNAQRLKLLLKKSSGNS